MHPVRLVIEDDLRRSRLTVFFRLLLWIPHYIWLTLFGFVAYCGAFLNWIVTLVRGESPPGVHDFLARYVRYQTHAYAYLFLVGNTFPGFVGEPGYPIDVQIDPPRRQSRWTVGFRIFLAIPCFLLQSVLFCVGYAVAFLAWFAALALGRMPEGLRNLGAFILRYGAQSVAYLFCLTERYPYSGPFEGGGREPFAATGEPLPSPDRGALARPTWQPAAPTPLAGSEPDVT